jgi:NAD(P)-dependent dehydrogenase (short-subunit alcohol dehydrogenase family)
VEIAGRTALVTGAAAGTGRAIALALAERGAHVVAADLDDAGGAETERRGRGAVRSVHLDVTDADALTAVVADTRPTVLVNNAGGGAHPPVRFPDAQPEQWLATLAVNLIAPMRATQLVLPIMRAAGGGAVVNIASTAATEPGPHRWPEYATAKAGLIRFTTSLREADGRVRINCLVPDWVATERLTPAERASTPPPVPLGAVAEQVLRLVTDDALSGRVVVLARGRPAELLD